MYLAETFGNSGDKSSKVGNPETLGYHESPLLAGILSAKKEILQI